MVTRFLCNVFVHGMPAPQGSKRHVGNGILVESSAKVGPWREAVKFAVLAAGPPAEPYKGPVQVQIMFVFHRPKSAPKRRRTWPITRSTFDIDKLQRSTFDALVDVGLIHDDSAIVSVVASKHYGEHIGAQIVVSVVEDH